MKLQFAIGREKPGASPRRASTDDVLVDHHHLQPRAQELRCSADAGHAAADNKNVALD